MFLSMLQKLQHTMETLGTFYKLGVTAPNTVADVPATLEAMEAKKKEYEELREKAKTEPEPEEEEAVDEEAGDEEESSKDVLANGDGPHANGNAGKGRFGGRGRRGRGLGDSPLNRLVSARTSIPRSDASAITAAIR
jgi:hypothetical protein